MRVALMVSLVVCGVASVAVAVVVLFGWPWALLGGGVASVATGLLLDDGTGRASVTRR